MKSEEFIGLLGDIDSRMIEKASEDLFNWQRSQEGEIVSAGTPRKTFLWMPIASVACAAAVVVGGFFLIRNIKQNGSYLVSTVSDSSSDQGGGTVSENSVPVSSENPVSSSVSSGGSELAPVVDNDPTKVSYENMVFEAVDPIDDNITYTWAVEPDRISYNSSVNRGDKWLYEDVLTSRQYLFSFFGYINDRAFGPESFWRRCLKDGHFVLSDVTYSGLIYSPVGGKVITVADNPNYGKSIAVEIPGGKIFVIHFLDEVYVRVGDVVTAGQSLGMRNQGDADKWDLNLIIMKKKTDLPEQDISKEFDGLTLRVTTDKSVYKVGEPIHLTATVENNTGEDFYVSYGWSENNFSLSTRIEGLVEYPRRVGGVIDDIAGYYLFKQGEKVVQDFTYQTYTGYCREIASADYDGVLRYYPDPDKPAESGTYFGYLAVSVHKYPTLDVAEEDQEKTYMLEFTIKINGDDAEDETAAGENTYTHYTEEMLKDYFIYDKVLYSNCYAIPVDWVIDNDRYGYNFDFSKVGELVAVIDGKADLQRFKDNTANVLPAGTKIYEFPDNSQLLIARSGDEYIPYMGMREG